MVRNIFKIIGLLDVCFPLATTSSLWTTQFSTDVCTCPCSSAALNLSADAEVTQDEAMEKAVGIHNFLTVDTRTTSSVNRTKTSQADPRSTSKSIGVVSVIFICLVFAVICLSDMISCFREEPVRPKKKKKKKKKKDVKEKQLSGSCETDNTWGDMRRTTNEDVTRDIDVSQSRRSTDDDITVISHASQSLRLPGVNIHTLSIGKLLFSANKSLFHFPVFTHPVEGGDISLSSFTASHLSEPLLPSPPRSPRLFRRSVAKDANLDNV